ncbi:MAG: hypothetical protein H6744_13815 [Deltaproteobacteria bacterium]|nr:hypothetical protein [Deltaproteobacteria bacterium]
MSGRDSGGPIRRRAGERKRGEAEQAAETATSTSDSSKDGEARQPSVPAKPAVSPVPTSAGGPGRRPVGRRVFEPGSGRSSTAPPPSGGKGRVGATRPGAGKAAPGGKASPKGGKDVRPSSGDADEQERAKALATEKGIPAVHALRVVRGEASLNDVLKALMRKERAQRLVERDGLDPGLAGQVASGHLSRERALLVQRIRQHRPHRIDRDALKLAEVGKTPIAFQTFGHPWVTGLVAEARTYEFDVQVDGAEGGSTSTVQKHDVKLVAQPDQIEGIEAGAGQDDGVVAENLGGTADRGARVRPEDEALIDLVESNTVIRCVLRDGQLLVGRIRSFGRWDFDLELQNGAAVTVLFHAVHPASRWK